MLSWTKLLLTRRSPSSQPTRRRPQPRKVRLLVEELESRVVPSTTYDVGTVSPNSVTLGSQADVTITPAATTQFTTIPTGQEGFVTFSATGLTPFQVQATSWTTGSIHFSAPTTTPSSETGPFTLGFTITGAPAITATGNNTFTYNPLSYDVGSIAPSAAPINSRPVITITPAAGTQFTALSNGATGTVTFTPASGTPFSATTTTQGMIWNANEIQLTVPDAPTGESGAFTLTFAISNQSSLSTTGNNTFTYNPVEISSTSPNTSPLTGGETIQIKAPDAAHGFGTNPANVAVNFVPPGGGTGEGASSFTLNATGTEIDAVVPGGFTTTGLYTVNVLVNDSPAQPVAATDNQFYFLNPIPSPSVVPVSTPTTFNDSLQLTFPTGDSAGGTLTFTLYDPSGTAVYTDGNVSVSGTGTYGTQSTGSNPGGYQATTIPGGAYQWKVAYTGDASNAAFNDTNNPANQVDGPIAFDFTVASDVQSQNVYLSLFATMKNAYTNTQSENIAAGTVVYLAYVNNPANSTFVYDYKPISDLTTGTNLPAFVGTNGNLVPASGKLEVDLPNLLVDSGRMLVGLGSAPLAPVTSGGVKFSAPTPASEGSNIYDFLEFSYDNGFFINTSLEDQFGIPIQLTVPNPVLGSSPAQVGVVGNRADVLGGYNQFVNASGASSASVYTELTTDHFGNTLPNTAPRLISPLSYLLDNPVQGPKAVGGNPSTGSLYYYYITAVNSSGVEAKAGSTLVEAYPTASKAVTLTWQAPPADIGPGVVAHYNIYRGTAGGTSWVELGTHPTTGNLSFVDNLSDPGTTVPSVPS